jgi:hypothetical protein
MEEFWNREGPAEIMMVAEGSQVHDLALVTHGKELLVGEFSQPSTELLLLRAISNAISREGC